MEKRYLEIEEAIYFKSRMINQTENLVLTKLGLKDSALNRGNDIRRDGQIGSSALTKAGVNDPYLMNLYAD